MQRWSHIALEQVLRSAARNRASATEAQYSALSLLARGERSRARTSYHVSGTSCPWTFCEPYNLQTSGLHSYGSDRSSLSSRVTATSRQFTDGQTEQPTRSFADAIQRLRQTQHRAKRRHALKKTVNAVSQEQQVAEPEPVNEVQRDIVTADASVASSRQASTPSAAGCSRSSLPCMPQTLTFVKAIGGMLPRHLSSICQLAIACSCCGCKSAGCARTLDAQLLKKMLPLRKTSCCAGS